MTPQEAIKAMKFNKENLYNGISNQFISAFDVAISALEKQIPKKVHRYDVNLSEKFCPNCGLSIENKGGYCAECGQALDWSDME
jgi:tRNA(Ile2) C34 agmatinyltransferase TiaS